MSRVRCHLLPHRYRSVAMNLEEVVAMYGGTLGYLNPTWIEWLMGYPDGWSTLPSQPSETPSCRPSLSGSEDA